jgi:hypothetical protein
MRKLTSFFVVAALFIGCSENRTDIGTDNGPENSSMLKKAKITANCTTIQSDLLKDSKGNPIKLGYDQWGYNYQAFMFNGYYDNYTRPSVPVTEGSNLEMKWNDAWLSNKDCDGDFKLDRHFGFPSYKGSGAWLTNHETGVNPDGSKYTYFVKIVAVPIDAKKINGTWYSADGILIGADIWGEFAIIQEVSNGDGYHGIQFVSPYHAGLGDW